MSKFLDICKLESQLSEKEVGCQLFYRETLPSTNDWAKQMLAQNEDRGEIKDRMVFLTDHQTAGKGRRGRVWKTEEGTAITMSLLIEPSISLDRISMLTLVMGMAAAEGIQKATGLQTGIKWPNDAVYEGKKLCGILSEMTGTSGHVIIGIGINVNTTKFPEELASTATSLRLAAGREFEREEVISSVLESFFGLYDIFMASGDLSGLKTLYESYLVSMNKPVRVLDPKEPFEGVARGIDEMGQLLVERADASIQAVFSGEVSVRGIYGYV